MAARRGGLKWGVFSGKKEKPQRSSKILLRFISEHMWIYIRLKGQWTLCIRGREKSPITNHAKPTQKISFQRSPKFRIGIRHFETNAQRPGRARPLRVTSFRSRDFVLASVFVLEVMADLQPYRFEPEHVSNPEDSESEKQRSVRKHI